MTLSEKRSLAGKRGYKAAGKRLQDWVKNRPRRGREARLAKSKAWRQARRERLRKARSDIKRARGRERVLLLIRLRREEPGLIRALYK